MLLKAKMDAEQEPSKPAAVGGAGGCGRGRRLWAGPASLLGLQVI